MQGKRVQDPLSKLSICGQPIPKNLNVTMMLRICCRGMGIYFNTRIFVRCAAVHVRLEANR